MMSFVGGSGYITPMKNNKTWFQPSVLFPFVFVFFGFHFGLVGWHHRLLTCKSGAMNIDIITVRRIRWVGIFMDIARIHFQFH